MKTQFAAVAAACACVSTAFGQGFSLHIAPEDGIVEVGETITITMAYQPTVPNRVLAGGLFDILQSPSSSGSGVPNPGTWLLPDGTTRPSEVSGSNLTIGWLQFPPFDIPTEGDLYRYSWTAEQEGDVLLSLFLTRVLVSELGGTQTSQLPRRSADNLNIQVVPTPAPLAALLSLGLIQARCRRRVVRSLEPRLTDPARPPQR